VGVVKNENHGFGNVAGLKPPKFPQIDVGKVWEQKELFLIWLLYNQIL